MFSGMKSLVATFKDTERTKEQKIGIAKEKIRKFLMGSNDKNGLVVQVVIYTLLICIGFVYLYPLLYMFVTSFKSLDDVLDQSVKWIPTQFYLKNYAQAFSVMNFKTSIVSTLYISLVPTLVQVVICSLVGYGFARYEFRGKNIMLLLMIFTFVIPPQITMMPTYVLYTDMKLLGSLKAFIYPALLGQGFKSAIFILIFYQFFRQTPKALYEAADIDGAGHIASFLKIALPSGAPAIIVVFLFSFVWYWNETYLVQMYLGNAGLGNKKVLTTILLQLKQFENNYEKLYPTTANANSPNRLNEAIQMAGTIIGIAPLMIVYFLLQKQFVESVDRTGITGE